jgi:hypothetical protein
VTNVKKDPTGFRELAPAWPVRAFGVGNGLIENLHCARPAARGVRDETEQEPKLGVPPFVDREMAVAYCCGQTGGSHVIASEITEHFFVQPLWTGELDV